MLSEKSSSAEQRASNCDITDSLSSKIQITPPDLLRVPRTPSMQKLSIVNCPLSTPVTTLRRCRKRHVETKMRDDPEEITVSLPLAT